MIRWMCGVKLTERTKIEELGELLGLEPVKLMTEKSRLRWFGHVDRSDDADWDKRCMTFEIEELDKQDAQGKHGGGDSFKGDIESLVLSQKDEQFRSKWKRRIRGNRLTQVHLEKLALKQCVCVCVCVRACVRARGGSAFPLLS